MSELISEEYRKQNEALHETGTYGISGANYRDLIRPLVDWGRKPILDYGCGTSTLKKSLGPAYTVYEYDPAIEGKQDMPEPCDVVACTDVLEHVEPDLMDNVIAHLRKLTTGTLFVSIALSPSSKTLDDGRNAHLSIHPVEWWKEKMAEHGFSIVEEKPAHRTKNLWWAVFE